MIDVIDGFFGYRKKDYVLENLSFSLSRGKILTILGKNGSGKTTLLKCITGIHKWDKGEMLIDGASCLNRCYQFIGYVPQAQKNTFSYTALEMVLMGCTKNLRNFSVPSQKDYIKAKECLSLLQIEDLSGANCSQLSGGQLQMVYIARALASDPKVLVVDEPEAHLDLKNQIMVLNRLKEMVKEKGLTCVINSHYPEHALNMADNTLLLKRGASVYGNTKDILTEDSIQEYFGIKVEIVTNKKTGNKALIKLELNNE